MASLHKGAVIIAQSGWPTVVINQTLASIINGAKNSGAGKIWGAEYGVDGILSSKFFNLHDQGHECLARVAQTPGAALGSKRKEPTEGECADIVQKFKEMDVRYFFFIGGDNTAHSTYLISKAAMQQNYEMTCIHVPKTIDNDILMTDHTPGFGSAALYVARSITGIETDNLALPGVHIVVTMGKEAGFLAASSAVRKSRAPDSSPHKIYVPEKEFSIDRFLQDVEETVSRLGRGVFVLAEGVRVNVGGERKTLIEWLGTSLGNDGFGRATLSGTSSASDYLVTQVKNKLNIKRVRGETFGYTQRSMIGVVSHVDEQEAQIAGIWAVRYALQDDVREGSVALNSLDGRKNGADDTQLASLYLVGNGKKPMDVKFLSDCGDGVSEAGVRYISQLIGEDKIPWVERLEPIYYKPGD